MAHPQDNRPLSFRMLVGLNVAILVLSVVVGACFFRGALGFADGVNMFSPYPKISVRIAATPYEYVSDWYNHMNGRVSQAIMDCGLFVYAKAFARTPEAFPWWLMRSLSLFCAMAAPFNFLVPAIGRGNCGLGAILGLYLTILVSWMLSYNVVTYSLWFDVLLTDRFLPIYVISLMCIILHRGWFEQTLFGEALHGALYLFFAVEQFLVTMPILFLAFAWVGDAKTRSKGFWLKRIFYYALLTALAAGVYFYSPGQRLRNRLLAPNPAGITFESIFAWLRDDLSRGYLMLWGDASHSVIMFLHLAVYCTVAVIAFVALCAYRSARRADQRFPPIDGLLNASVLSLAFLTAYGASLATLFIKRHFPEYAIHYPAILLAVGLGYGVLVIIQLLDGVTWTALRSALHPETPVASRPVFRYWPSFLPWLALGALIAGVLAPSWPKLQAGYHEVKAHGQIRHEIFQQVIQLHQATGQTHFILIHCPVRSHGGTMEPPWGVEGYFRWCGYGNLIVYLDDNYDFPTRPLDR